MRHCQHVPGTDRFVRDETTLGRRTVHASRSAGGGEIRPQCLRHNDRKRQNHVAL
jgi:hypothetical protein